MGSFGALPKGAEPNDVSPMNPEGERRRCGSRGSWVNLSKFVQICPTSPDPTLVTEDIKLKQKIEKHVRAISLADMKK